VGAEASLLVLRLQLFVLVSELLYFSYVVLLAYLYVEGDAEYSEVVRSNVTVVTLMVELVFNMT